MIAATYLGLPHSVRSDNKTSFTYIVQFIWYNDAIQHILTAPTILATTEHFTHPPTHPCNSTHSNMHTHTHTPFACEGTLLDHCTQPLLECSVIVLGSLTVKTIHYFITSYITPCTCTCSQLEGNPFLIYSHGNLDRDMHVHY